MSAESANLDRFLRAVHRRWVIVRAAEHVGVCAAGACGVALFFLPILLWRGDDALAVVATTVAIGVIAGLIAGVIRRPGLLSAATEADRQLDLADLLSTALATRNRRDADPWAATVLATADARCRALAANDVILNRLGARAWGGIGLSAALVLTLALMSANPRRTEARAAPKSVESSAVARGDAKPAAEQAGAPAHAARQQSDAARRVNDVGDRSANEVASGPSHAAANHQNQTATKSDGGGAGTATSYAQPDLTPPPRQRDGPSPGTANTGDLAASGGFAPANATAGTDAAGASVAKTEQITPAPPWQSSAWPAAREQALSAVRDGRVPDGYRDLVREYFTQGPP